MIKTDFHIHLLPDLDCSGKTENAIKILLSAKRHGVDTIVLTPHYYPDYEEVLKFTERRDRNAEILKQAMALEPELSNITLRVGAELLSCCGVENLPNIEKLCIDDTKTLLVEMPGLKWNNKIVKSLENLSDKGYNVIIAHADRYDRAHSEALMEKGFSVQINAESLLKIMTRGYVIKWIKSGFVCAIGSDIHNSHDLDLRDPYLLFDKADRQLSKCTKGTIHYNEHR